MTATAARACPAGPRALLVVVVVAVVLFAAAAAVVKGQQMEARLFRVAAAVGNL